MIVLYTDFGVSDPYVGQLHAVLYREAPEERVIDLLHNVPAFGIEPGAYLLPAMAETFPRGAVFLCVVDPGVGGPREAIVLEVDGKWYVGPDNGLLSVVLARGGERRAWRIAWRPERLSASFHGRDLFAPVAAAVARGDLGRLEPVEPMALESGRLAPVWPPDLAKVIYVDHYGNAVTGWRGEDMNPGRRIIAGSREIPHARTFCETEEGSPFWYVDSMGLVEISVSRGSAAEILGLAVGHPVEPAG